MTWPSSLFLLITAGFSQSYLFLISIFFSNLFILNLYKQINNSLFLFRILLVCEIFYKLPCGPRTSAAGSQSVSFRFHYKLVLRHIYAVFFCKFNNNARIQIFVRSRKRDLQAESCRKACKLLHCILNMNIVSVAVGKALFDKMAAV